VTPASGLTVAVLGTGTMGARWTATYFAEGSYVRVVGRTPGQGCGGWASARAAHQPGSSGGEVTTFVAHHAKPMAAQWKM